MWGGWFQVSCFHITGWKKNPFQTKKKTASTAERACPESTENFPILPPQLLCHRPDRPVLEGFGGGGWSQAEQSVGDSPFGGGSACLPA